MALKKQMLRIRFAHASRTTLLAVSAALVLPALAVEDSDAGEASARAAGLDVLRVQSPSEMPELLRERIELSPR